MGREPAPLRIATHEAGHVVACLVYGRTFERVSMREDDASFGRVVGYRPRRIRTAGVVDVEHIVICLAGARAERRLGGRAWRTSARCDLDDAVAGARGVHAEGAVRGPRSPLVRGLIMGARAEADMLMDIWWPAVRRVADDLLARGSLALREVVALTEDPSIQEQIGCAHQRWLEDLGRRGRPSL